MADVFLGLGANTGDPRANLRRALQLLAPAGEIVAVSSLWTTEPVGYLEQDWFLNAAVHLRTTHTPLQLLALLQEIERALGRQRTIPNGPRTIDLDILLWDDAVIAGPPLTVPPLTIPHPRMHERLFVIEPLFELAPDTVVPLLGLTVARLRDNLAGSMRIELAARAPW